MQLNPNEKVVEAIHKRLVATNGYCPCVPEQNPDTICPCKKMREEGHCCCTLYVKK
ncbi:MAG: ferredoxin thioredoxin reductase catalytic beta chain [Candidatus Riflebacteria bacterium]|nr:ferredoxin thioredoxin reductase catalytic beta chain [Candidatus Riflebacteria bacterium]